MNTISKKRSKTVQQRQLKRLTPRHYEILIRYAKGQRQRQIAKEMNLGEQWLSVVINSPVFQEELHKLLREDEAEFLKRLSKPRMKSNDAVTAMTPSTADSGALQPLRISDDAGTREWSTDTSDGLGETIINALSRMDDARGKTRSDE